MWKICEQARKNVEDTTAGFSVMCYDTLEAKKLAEYLNEKYETIPNLQTIDLTNDFKEWDELITWIDKTSRRLVEIEEIYQEESKRILSEAIATGVDFKRLYGGNTEKTRKQYVDEQLSDLIQEKQDLKFCQADDLRRIEFLKKLIDMKLKLMTFNEGVDLK